MNRLPRALAVVLSLCVLVAASATRLAAQAPAPDGFGAGAAASPDVPPITQEELDQMLAPIALYPDDLLAQVLMACTYPIEIVQADRWVKANPGLEGDALAAQLEEQSWDPSVKSLVNFPDVLASLSAELDWTVKIGNAFLADQNAVMDTVQRLRSKAELAGNLSSSEKLTVKTEPPAEGSNTQIILIESPNPNVIYVPVYDPAVIYGPWWYPLYPPPIYYRPRGFLFGRVIGFSIVYYFGPAWGYAWGGCSWRHHNVSIDIHRHIRFNARIPRSRYLAELSRRGVIRNGTGIWHHDPTHRRGFEYRDRVTAQRFGGLTRQQAARARDAYRGRAASPRAGLIRGRAPRAGAAPARPGTAAPRPPVTTPPRRPVTSPPRRPVTSPQRRPVTSPQKRPVTSPQKQPGAAANRGRNATGSRERASGTVPSIIRPSGKSGAFSGSSRGREAARESARGAASRHEKAKRSPSSKGIAPPRGKGASSKGARRPSGKEAKRSGDGRRP